MPRHCFFSRRVFGRPFDDLRQNELTLVGNSSQCRVSDAGIAVSVGARRALAHSVNAHRELAAFSIKSIVAAEMQ